jgi:chromosome segregation ATPase
MFDKIKGLIDSQDKINDMHSHISSYSKSLEEQKEIINGLHAEITTLKTNFEALNSAHTEHLSQMKEDIDDVREIKSQLNNELNDLKLLKTHIKEKLVEELAASFKNELTSHAERIKTDAKSYNDMKQALQAIVLRLEQLKPEIDKFNNIAKTVKEKDFELEKYAKNLKNFSDEKHELLMKIDNLERMIGRERRHR